MFLRMQAYRAGNISFIFHANVVSYHRLSSCTFACQVCEMKCFVMLWCELTGKSNILIALSLFLFSVSFVRWKSTRLCPLIDNISNTFYLQASIFQPWNEENVRCCIHLLLIVLCQNAFCFANVLLWMNRCMHFWIVSHGMRNEKRWKKMKSCRDFSENMLERVESIIMFFNWKVRFERKDHMYLSTSLLKYSNVLTVFNHL